MSVFLNCESLEARENPVGPVVVDPVGIPVLVPPPSHVGADVMPAQPTSGTTANDAIIQKIIAETLAGLVKTW